MTQFLYFYIYIYKYKYKYIYKGMATIGVIGIVLNLVI